MEMPKILIVDPSEEFRSALTAALDPSLQVFNCTRGDEALPLIRQLQPDVLVLELQLQGLDGIGLLRKLDRIPRTLIVTALASPYVLGSLEQLQVQYVLLKSCPISVAAERVLELARMQEAPALPQQEAHTLALLDSLGLPGTRQGFQHMLTGIPLLVTQRDQRMTKELYPIIARENNATSRSVEKAIRDTIRAGWEQGSRDTWLQYFPGQDRCPGNKEFLYRMADLLRTRQKCG